MREIEFRGKRIDNGEWVYGDLIRHYENQRRFIVCDQLAYTYSEYGIDRLVSERYYEVIPETIGQYTGLKDRDGTKIYEGDAIKCAYDNLYELVEYQNGGFEPLVIKGWECEYDADDYMVIGNIHDNPELLGGAE